MSLLADLLSKRNNAEPTGSKDIPPTLSEAHVIPAKVRSLKSRYIVISLVCASIIAAGVLGMSQFGQLAQFLTKKTSLPTPPQKAPIAAVAVAPLPQAIVPPPAPPLAVEAQKPPAPQPEKSEAKKKKSIKAKSARRKWPVKADKRPPLTATLPDSKPVPAVTSGTAAAGTIDTAKRDALLYTARSAEQASDWRLALANYRKAQQIDPDNHVIMNNAAAAMNNLGMFDDGVKEAKRALSKKPDYVPAMVNAAIGYSSKGNSQEALQLFSEAALADPGNRSLVINLGIMQERAGKLDDAWATYRPLADDGDPLALQGMGRVYERKGNRLEAVRIYRQIMALPGASLALKKEVKSTLKRLEE